MSSVFYGNDTLFVVIAAGLADLVGRTQLSAMAARDQRRRLHLVVAAATLVSAGFAHFIFRTNRHGTFLLYRLNLVRLTAPSRRSVIYYSVLPLPCQAATADVMV